MGTGFNVFEHPLGQLFALLGFYFLCVSFLKKLSVKERAFIWEDLAYERPIFGWINFLSIILIMTSLYFLIVPIKYTLEEEKFDIDFVINGINILAIMYGIRFKYSVDRYLIRSTVKIWDQILKSFFEDHLNEVVSRFHGKIIGELFSYIPLVEHVGKNGKKHTNMPENIREAYYSHIYGELTGHQKSYLKDIENNLGSHLDNNNILHSSKEVGIIISESGQFSNIGHCISITDSVTELSTGFVVSEIIKRFDFRATSEDGAVNLIQLANNNIEDVFDASISVNGYKVCQLSNFLSIENGELILSASPPKYSLNKETSNCVAKYLLSSEDEPHLPQEISISLSEYNANGSGFSIEVCFPFERKNYNNVITFEEDSILLHDDDFYSFKNRIPFWKGKFKIEIPDSLCFKKHCFGKEWELKRKAEQLLELEKMEWSFLGGVEGIAMWKLRNKKSR